MNILDIIIVGVMAFCLVRGIYRGFFREIGSLTGAVAGIWLAHRYYPQVTGRLETYFPEGNYLSVIGFVLIFLMILIICNLLGWALMRLCKTVLLSGVDRALGGAVAVLKGMVVVYFAMLILTFFVPPESPIIARSRLGPVIIASYQSLVNAIAPDAYRRWKQKFQGIGTEPVMPL